MATLTVTDLDARPAPRSSFADCTGQRRTATVLFADIRGSMALSESVGPEEWWSMIELLFELMAEAVHLTGGWVGAFTGDGIYAVFEGHDGACDHARQACLAALAICDAMQAPAAELRRRHGLELSVRIGINSGKVVTGSVGARDHRYRTACGYTVALAQRMEALATPGRIFLTEHTAALVADSLQVHDLGSFAVKGAPVAVGVHVLLGELCSHAVAPADAVCAAPA